MRPKRASHAAGIASLFSMVPVASASAMRAPRAFDRRSTMVSARSSCESSRTMMLTTFDTLPGRKRRVPERAT